VAGDLLLADNNFGTSTVYQFGPTAQNTDPPASTITGSMTNITSIGGIAIDAAGQVYVANADPAGAAILVFSAGASGNVPPARTIAGASTTLAGDASQAPMPILLR
jgi:hypothetical protein